MKKKYSKPDILFESFSLSTSIAAGCEVKTDTPVDKTCGYRFGAYMVYIQEVDGCSLKQPDGSIPDLKHDGSYNYFCYHNPSPENNLFNS